MRFIEFSTNKWFDYKYKIYGLIYKTEQQKVLNTDVNIIENSCYLNQNT